MGADYLLIGSCTEEEGGLLKIQEAENENMLRVVEDSLREDED